MTTPTKPCGGSHVASSSAYITVRRAQSGLFHAHPDAGLSGAPVGEVGSGLGPPRDLELGQDHGHVVLDGLLGQVEPNADVSVPWAAA